MKKSLFFPFFTLPLIVSTFSVSADNHLFDMPINIPGSEYIDATHPTMSEWGGYCANARDNMKDKVSWGLCNGYLSAVIQHNFLKRKKKCPNYTVGDFFRFAPEEATEYQHKNAKPLTSLSSGGVSYTYENVPAPGQRPAFGVLESILVKKCNIS